MYLFFNRCPEVRVLEAARCRALSATTRLPLVPCASLGLFLLPGGRPQMISAGKEPRAVRRPSGSYTLGRNRRLTRHINGKTCISPGGRSTIRQPLEGLYICGGWARTSICTAKRLPRSITNAELYDSGRASDCSTPQLISYPKLWRPLTLGAQCVDKNQTNKE
jgi:hypothetical protein